MTCARDSIHQTQTAPDHLQTVEKIILAVSKWHSKTRKTCIFLEYLTFYTISRKDNCQTFNCHFPCAKIKHIYNIYTIPPWSEADRGDGSPERSDRGSRQSSSVTDRKYANAKNQHML